MNPPKMNANIYCNGQKRGSQHSAFSKTRFTAKGAKDAKDRLGVQGEDFCLAVSSQESIKITW
jgi:hypothetical protein